MSSPSLNIISDAASKSSTSDGGLLAQLGAMLESNAADAKLFASLLAEEPNSASVSASQTRLSEASLSSGNQSVNQHNGAATDVSQTSSSTGASGSPAHSAPSATATAQPLTAKTNITSVWREFLGRLRERERLLQNKSGVKTSPKASSATTAGDGSTPIVTQTQTITPGVAANAGLTAPANSANTNAMGTAGTVDAAAATAVSSAVPSDNLTAAPTAPADLLTELQALAQSIEKKLQALSDAGTISATSNTIATTPAAPAASGASAAQQTALVSTTAAPTSVDFLTQFLSLIQVAEQRLQADAGGTTQTTANAAGVAPQDTSSNTAAVPTPLTTPPAPTPSETQSGASSLAAALLAPQSLATAPVALGQPAGPAMTADLQSLDRQIRADLKTLTASVQGGSTQTEGYGSGVASARIASQAQGTNQTYGSQGQVDQPSTASANTPASGLPAREGLGNSLAALSDQFLGLVQGNTGMSETSSPGVAAGLVPVSEATTTLLDPQGKSGSGMGADEDKSNGTPALLTSNLDTNSLAGAQDTKASNPYSFASQLTATRAPMSAMGLPSAVEQVILQMNRNVKTGNDQMTLQLHPADLGKINIKLDISSDGKVQGTVVASNPATLNLLLKDVRSLERALQEAGLRADPGSLQFSLGDQAGNSSGQSAGNANANASQGNKLVISAPESASVPVSAGDVWYLTPNRVNFKV